MGAWMTTVCIRQGCMNDVDVELMRCPLCKFALYCSRACERIDWSYHRVICQQTHGVIHFKKYHPKILEQCMEYTKQHDATKHEIIHMLDPTQYTQITPSQFIASLRDQLTIASVIEHVEHKGTIYVYNDDARHFYVIEGINAPSK